MNGGGPAELPIFTRRRLIQTLVVVVALLVGIYFLFPKLVGLGNALGKLDDADPIWIAIAIGFNVVAFATYVALFKAVVGGDALRLTWLETYEINMAGLAATLLFSAAGAGGIVLTYWALRKAGMRRHDVARRMVAFLTLHYAFYPIALILFGVLLRTGVLNGKASVELTIVPAGGRRPAARPRVAAGADPARPAGRGSRRFVHGERGREIAANVARCRRPSPRGSVLRSASSPTPPRAGSRCSARPASGRRTSASSGPPSTPSASTCRLPSSSRASSSAWSPTSSPSRPAGVGAVDAGMIGAFVLFGIPEETVFPAILIYRLIAFWMPIPFGVAAFFQLRTRVQHWETEGLPIDRRPSGELASETTEGVL